MIILGIVLSVFAIVLMCWLLFTLAVYALPVFVGLSAAFAAFHNGYGLFGSALIAILASAITLGFGRLAFAAVRTPIARAGVAMLFASPAAVAGYYATIGLAHIAMAPSTISNVLGIVGACVVGATAWTRMGLAPPTTDRNAASDHMHAPRAPAHG
jgi:hypothetical protein